MHTEILVVIFSLFDNQLQVLLSQAENQPARLPGQEMDARLGLEDTALRGLAACTGLKHAYLEQLYTYGDLQRGAPERTLSIVYFALLSADAVRRAPAIPPAAWWPVKETPALEGDHAEILQYALRRLRYKLEYSAVGFELLPENFSLSELQRTYELILGENLDKRNFRRRILTAGIIEPTPHQRSGEGRPARLFRYRPDAIAEVKARRLFP